MRGSNVNYSAIMKLVKSFHISTLEVDNDILLVAAAVAATERKEINLNTDKKGKSPLQCLVSHMW